jgi:DNA (cytosine-5)-methyltransferase 1
VGNEVRSVCFIAHGLRGCVAGYGSIGMADAVGGDAPEGRGGVVGMTLTYGSCFAGIGGMDLGLDRAGMVCRWQIENDEYRKTVLARHWPEVKRYDDIRAVHSVEQVDVICGGFPCQDLSYAGLQAGLSGDRSGLYRELFRLVRQGKPSYVLVENVAALLRTEYFTRLVDDFTAIGYDTEWKVLRGTDFNAPHERRRVFVVAYPYEGNGTARMGSVSLGTPPIFCHRDPECLQFWVQASDLVARMDDGATSGTYRQRGEAIGDAVMPQMAEWLGRQIVAHAQALRRAA